MNKIKLILAPSSQAWNKLHLFQQQQQQQQQQRFKH